LTEEKLLTVEEVSEWLAIAERTVMSLAARGELPGSKIGKQWRFSRAQVQDYVNRQQPQQRHEGISEG